MQFKETIDIAQIQQQMQQKLSDYRYQHCVRTSQRAKELAQMNHGDVEKAQIAVMMNFAR